MTRWAPAKRDTMASVAAEVAGLYTGRIVVAVDGIAGAGAGAVADGLADALREAGRPVERATLTTDRSGASDPAREPAGFKDEVLRAFRTAGDEPAVLVVDGPFLLRRSLKGAWNYSVWVDVPPALAEERAREDGVPETELAAARDTQSVYRGTASPRRSASAILDNRDPGHPRRVFADSC